MTSTAWMINGDDSESAEALAALQSARSAIARWSGSAVAAEPAERDVVRVSPQARWIDEAQRNLAQWIARGGFSAAEGASTPLPALMRPVMYSPTLPRALQSVIDQAMAD